MSVQQTPDGEWYVRFTKGKVPDRPNATREYYGQGEEGKIRAYASNSELGFGRVRGRKRVSEEVYETLRLRYQESEKKFPYSQKVWKAKFTGNCFT